MVYSLRPDYDQISKDLRRLECRLDDWESALPEFLRVNQMVEMAPVNGSSSLHFGFLSVKLLLSRIAFKVHEIMLQKFTS